MSTVNFVVPALSRTRFTGGIHCIFEYAKGLTARGHRVHILPLLPSPAPRWVAGEFGTLLRGSAADRPRTSLGWRETMKDLCRAAVGAAGMHSARFLDPEARRGFQLKHARELMVEADATVATSFETALPVHLYGTGRRCYFMQHFEPYFSIDMPERRWTEHEAQASYRLGLNMIANSSWLRAKVFECTGVEPALCTNAIDHAVFSCDGRQAAASDQIRVISYGGRRASWKGFREMAAAMGIVRRALPGRSIKWMVYGDCVLPPKNDVECYESLGFLQLPALAQAYRSADILLSASWYESFPLFPLEAMACGLAVITTQPGTEEFAFHGRTAEIVEPRDEQSIANGLRRLVTDTPYRQSLAANGQAIAAQFSWGSAVSRLEYLLFN